MPALRISFAATLLAWLPLQASVAAAPPEAYTQLAAHVRAFQGELDTLPPEHTDTPLTELTRSLKDPKITQQAADLLPVVTTITRLVQVGIVERCGKGSSAPLPPTFGLELADQLRAAGAKYTRLDTARSPIAPLQQDAIVAIGDLAASAILRAAACAPRGGSIESGKATYVDVHALTPALFAADYLRRLRLESSPYIAETLDLVMHGYDLSTGARTAAIRRATREIVVQTGVSAADAAAGIRSVDRAPAYWVSTSVNPGWPSGAAVLALLDVARDSLARGAYLPSNVRQGLVKAAHELAVVSRFYGGDDPAAVDKHYDVLMAALGQHEACAVRYKIAATSTWDRADERMPGTVIDDIVTFLWSGTHDDLDGFSHNPGEPTSVDFAGLAERTGSIPRARRVMCELAFRADHPLSVEAALLLGERAPDDKAFGRALAIQAIEDAYTSCRAGHVDVISETTRTFGSRVAALLNTAAETPNDRGAGATTLGLADYMYKYGDTWLRQCKPDEELARVAGLLR